MGLKMENCKLPGDMVVDILSRLPVKSFMRFKCVCKIFYDLIKSDHHFMHKHYEISKAKTDCVVLEASYDVREYYLLYKESEYNEIGCIYLDIPRVQSVRCCKGVLCLISARNDHLKPGDYLIYDILIWNPSIRKVKALPSVIVPYKGPCNAIAFGNFGFGISNNMTWKVVMLLEICALGGNALHQITMVVYRQDHSDSWSLKQINSVTPCQNICQKIICQDFYLKGRYYWRAEWNYTDYLIWFDMNDEVFGTIELPSNFAIGGVSIMNETIALLGYSEVSECIDIWLMVENDNNTYWVKQAFPNIDIFNNTELWRPIGIWNVGGELLVFIDRIVHGFSHELWDLEAPGDVPYFISLDLITQERNKFSISKERKSITMAANSTTGYFQVYNERNIDIIEEWKHNIFRRQIIYARVYHESLHLP